MCALKGNLNESSFALLLRAELRWRRGSMPAPVAAERRVCTEASSKHPDNSNGGGDSSGNSSRTLPATIMNKERNPVRFSGTEEGRGRQQNRILLV